jgi:hypothetical protein
VGNPTCYKSKFGQVDRWTGGQVAIHSIEIPNETTELSSVTYASSVGRVSNKSLEVVVRWVPAVRKSSVSYRVSVDGDSTETDNFRIAVELYNSFP